MKSSFFWGADEFFELVRVLPRWLRRAFVFAYLNIAILVITLSMMARRFDWIGLFFSGNLNLNEFDRVSLVTCFALLTYVYVVSILPVLLLWVAIPMILKTERAAARNPSAGQEVFGDLARVALSALGVFGVFWVIAMTKWAFSVIW